MGLRQDVPKLVKYYKDNTDFFDHNAKLFDVSEGNLLPLILKDLKKQLSENSYEQIQHRVAPINVMNKVVSKLSTIYSKPPNRSVVGGKKRDNTALGELIRVMEYDTAMADANAFVNTFKSTWIEPFLDEGMPRLRSIPSDRFFVWSNNTVDPTRPTHLIKLMGVDSETKAVIFYAYTADEFLVFDSQENIRSEIMASIGNPAGVNEYKVLPGVYVNRSKYCLMPMPDTDMLAMTKLIPILLSDCNFALMYQAFSIVYGIDVDDQNLKMAPNAFWRFKSSPTAAGDVKPEVGVLKPQVDSDKVLNLVQAEVAMWLDSKGIKAGSVGKIMADDSVSGVAKMIDEADTTEDRKRQVSVFSPKDSRLLELVINNMIPVWKRDPAFKLEVTFLGQAYRVSCDFPEQLPVVDEGATTDAEVKKLTAGLTTRELSIKKLNPDMTDEEVQELIAKIDAERIKNQEYVQAPTPGPNGTDPNNPDPNAPKQNSAGGGGGDLLPQKNAGPAGGSVSVNKKKAS